MKVICLLTIFCLFLPLARCLAQNAEGAVSKSDAAPVAFIDRRWGEIRIDWKENKITSDLGGWVNNVRWQGYGNVRFHWHPGVYPPDTSGEPVDPYQGHLSFAGLPERHYSVWVDDELVGFDHHWRRLLEEGLTVDGLPASGGGPDRAELSIEVLIRSD